MRLARGIAGLIGVVLVSASAWAFAGAGKGDVPAKLPKLQFLNKDTMSLGIASPVPDQNGPQPVEVQLHVSEDGGKHWEKAAVVDPSAKSFIFRAPHDGEFWFMVRTKYPDSTLRPNEPPRPMSRAMVDTTPPTLEIVAEHGDGGEIRVGWHTRDANLDSKSLKLEYRPAGADAADWQPIALDAPPPGTNGEYRGQVDVMPQDAGGGVVLRGVVLDRAKNVMTTERIVSPPPSVVDRRGQRTTRPTITRWDPVSTGMTQASEAGREDDSPDDGNPREMSHEFPHDVRDAGGPDLDGEPIGPGVRGGPAPRSAADARRNEPTAEVIGTPRHDGHRTVAEQSRSTAEGSRARRRSDDEELPRAYEGELLPPGVHPHRVNSLRFELMYEVDAVGSSGVARVELWATRDGGRHWESFGEDDDCSSPMLVEVDGEGIYGFRVVVESGAGRRGLLPKPGDLPDVWVGVDLTRPHARLVAAEQGVGDDAGELIIDWEADDEQLAVRPIALAFSESPGGPWTNIASGLENTGRYAWRLDRHVPERIFLRLEVRDEAGNVATVESQDAVSIDRARPQGRIRGVRSRDE
jgi:hypothetical protein